MLSGISATSWHGTPRSRSWNTALRKRDDIKRESLVVPDDHLVLVNFDHAGTVVSQHLVVHLIDDTLVLESCEIIYFIQVERIDQISVLVDQTNLDVGG